MGSRHADVRELQRCACCLQIKPLTEGTCSEGCAIACSEREQRSRAGSGGWIVAAFLAGAIFGLGAGVFTAAPQIAALARYTGRTR